MKLYEEFKEDIFGGGGDGDGGGDGAVVVEFETVVVNLVDEEFVRFQSLVTSPLLNSIYKQEFD